MRDFETINPSLFLAESFQRTLDAKDQVHLKKDEAALGKKDGWPRCSRAAAHGRAQPARAARHAAPARDRDTSRWRSRCSSRSASGRSRLAQGLVDAAAAPAVELVPPRLDRDACALVLEVK